MPKTILIIGSSRGIGRATALIAGRRGWSVAVNYVGNRAAAEEVAVTVKNTGGNAVALQGDISVEAEVVDLFGATLVTPAAISATEPSTNAVMVPPMSIH